jgi:hypothetical protein
VKEAQSLFVIVCNESLDTMVDGHGLLEVLNAFRGAFTPGPEERGAAIRISDVHVLAPAVQELEDGQMATASSNQDRCAAITVFRR